MGDNNQDNSGLRGSQALIGGASGLLGGLISLKSQQDLIRRRQKMAREAESTTRQAAGDVQRAVVSAGAQRGGGVGLQQGLRQADRMQRQALRDVGAAQARDRQFQMGTAEEQRKLGLGIGNMLTGFGTQLAMSTTPSGAAAPAKDNTLANLTGMAQAAGPRDAIVDTGGEYQGAEQVSSDMGPGAWDLNSLPMPSKPAPEVRQYQDPALAQGKDLQMPSTPVQTPQLPAAPQTQQPPAVAPQVPQMSEEEQYRALADASAAEAAALTSGINIQQQGAQGNFQVTGPPQGQERLMVGNTGLIDAFPVDKPEMQRARGLLGDMFPSQANNPRMAQQIESLMAMGMSDEDIRKELLGK